MYRRLSLVLAVSAALVPLSAQALGLGDIRVNSALNQPFNAEIDLQSLEDNFSLEDLNAKIPEEKVFSQAGVERSYILTQLIFTPRKNPAGRPVLSIKSSDPIREVYLDFLVEVAWPQGRVVKGYTVLLDPPPPPPSRLPSVTREAARGAEEPFEYGPVRAVDTLWSIVRRAAIRGATPYQVAMALWQYNPDAFVKGNINRLRVDSKLRLPGPQAAFERSSQDAYADYTTARRAPSHLALPIGASLSQPKPSHPAEPSPVAVAAMMDQVRGKPSQTAQPGLGVVSEELVALHRENNELKTRIRDLEVRVADLSRQQSRSVPVETPPVAVTSATPVTPPAAPVAVTPPVVAQFPEVLSIPAILPTSPPGPAVEVPSASSPSEAAVAPSVPPPPPPVQVPETPPAPLAEPPPQAPAVPMTEQAPPVPEPAWYESLITTPVNLILELLAWILDNFVVVFLGLAGLVVGFWVWKRRKESVADEASDSWESTTEEPLPPENFASGTLPLEPLSGSPDTDTASRDSSFLQGFDSRSSTDSALMDDTSEVDPINEADVYVAYGRYQQAEDILKQAIQRFPDRFPIKEKLLDIYATKSRNVKAFTELAESLSDSGLPQERPDSWARVQALGRELDPNNLLFGGKTSPEVPAKQADAAHLGLGLDSGARYTPSETPTTLMGDIDMGDLDLSDINKDMGDLDLSDLSDLNKELEGLSPATVPASSPSRPFSAPVDEDSLDLGDLDLGHLDLDHLDVELDTDLTAATPAAKTSSPVADILSDDLDLDLLLSEPEPKSSLPSSYSLDDLESAQDDVAVVNVEDESRGDAGFDDISTKLDLARAYLEMDDPEGARELLEEVLRGGSAQQKSDAQSILAKIT
ncbi:MAG: FimV/HubP family polar landmark protein [Pseudomonadota bacterium]